MKFKTAYGPRERVQLKPVGPSLAKQSMADECDINLIMEKYHRTGMVAHLAKGQPRYADVSEMEDFRGALEYVDRVREFFDGLPAEVRADFENDPAVFVDYVADPENAEALKEFGLESRESQRVEPSSAEEPAEPVKE